MPGIEFRGSDVSMRAVQNFRSLRLQLEALPASQLDLLSSQLRHV